MQAKITIARPYAQAIFEVACAEKKIAQWLDTLHLLETIITHADMRRAVEDPRLAPSALADFILHICGKKTPKKLHNLVQVLAHAKRLSCISEICILYEQLRIGSEGIVKISIIAPYSLSSEQKLSIVDMMTKRTGSKIEIDEEDSIIDQSLIGGLMIRTGDKVFDASIRGRFKTVSNAVA